jgi:hypothetical protein
MIEMTRGIRTYQDKNLKKLSPINKGTEAKGQK